MIQDAVFIVGTGPSALLAGLELARAGVRIEFHEKRKSPGRKLLVAGSSGLNITYDAPVEEFARNYTGPRERFEEFLKGFPPEAWLGFIEGLGIGTFKGTSRRYFVEGMKASQLLKVWVAELEKLGARFHYGQELIDFESLPGGGVRLRFEGGHEQIARAALLALGGGSWEPSEKPLRWPAIFERKGIAFAPFVSSNVGLQCEWPRALLEEAEGKPLKNVVLSSPRGSRSGDPVITSYGMEGTPVYFAGVVGLNHLDLKPDLSAKKVLSRLRSTKENLSPMRRMKRLLGLSEASQALVFHLTPPEVRDDLEKLAQWIKHFPITFTGRQSLDESISSSGGVRWSEVGADLGLLQAPGVFVSGEMLDWDAPTGGFLLQACVSQGFHAARGILRFLGR